MGPLTGLRRGGGLFALPRFAMSRWSSQRVWNSALALGQVVTLALLLAQWRQPAACIHGTNVGVEAPQFRPGRRLEVGRLRGGGAAHAHANWRPANARAHACHDAQACKRPASACRPACRPPPPPQAVTPPSEGGRLQAAVSADSQQVPPGARTPSTGPTELPVNQQAANPGYAPGTGQLTDPLSCMCVACKGRWVPRARTHAALRLPAVNP